MDTNRLKRFATEARTILMQGVKNRLQTLGFDLKTGKPSEMPQAMEGGAVLMGEIVSMDFYHRWMSLYRNIQSRSIKEVAEEAAYTWFNRFMLSASWKSRTLPLLCWNMRARRFVCL